MFKEFVCRGCHSKCVISMENIDENWIISGNDCIRGIEYANNEMNTDKDIFTTVIRIKGAKKDVVSVKSNKPIEKKLWIDCAKALSMLHVGAPIKIGDVVCRNLLNTGVDIICTKNLDRV